jgi:head-tail adaptor
MAAGKLNERIAFDQQSEAREQFGGQKVSYSEQFQRHCQMIHMSGSESVDAARLAGREVYKIKVRSSVAVRAVTSGTWQLRDVRRDKVYNIQSIDAVTDRRFVWIVAEA